jgi:hypothetical protein
LGELPRRDNLFGERFEARIAAQRIEIRIRADVFQGIPV